jgi:hypothetical protein
MQKVLEMKPNLKKLLIKKLQLLKKFARNKNNIFLSKEYIFYEKMVVRSRLIIYEIIYRRSRLSSSVIGHVKIQIYIQLS